VLFSLILCASGQKVALKAADFGSMIYKAPQQQAFLF
jgi:hypothetical protein